MDFTVSTPGWLPDSDPDPLALTTNLVLSAVADIRPALSLDDLKLTVSEVLGAWRFAR